MEAKPVPAPQPRPRAMAEPLHPALGGGTQHATLHEHGQKKSAEATE